MRNKEISILVVGAGAIGGITAAFLKREGYNVGIVCKYDDYAKTISNDGIHVTGVCGNFTVTIPAWSDIKDVQVKKDLVLLATKATEMIGAARELKNVLKDKGQVVSMQNGICEDDLAEVLGREKIIGCVTGWGATMISRGSLEMTSAGEFILGYTDRPADTYLYDLAGILSSVVPTAVTDNILGHLYSKLIVNACITSLGAICGLYLGKMLSVTKIRKIFIEIIREAVAVSDAMNIKLEVFGERLDFHKFIMGDNLTASLRRHLTILFIGFRYRRLKSSSLQSLERGKPTEVDYLNGYIVRNGMSRNIAVPVNSAITGMIHEIEQKKRDISPDNFNDPVFDCFDN
ncbi:MAG TPA: 2-dehydropantoate 2-reductase [Bacteroidales bacterium]|nr:2-dehydropantoate 2-reductase [Bacteroidales bacterium]HPJ59501.1 2-dehydropantoate 2-reductase [Bacteroidales bacterium]HPR12884.1 2-dehydropantoate 2-reductase [Bacteroidales bacterium]HRW85089.1 2-dehydropantoate 2-reductase [Bacteroidales bacterium]